MYWQKASCHIYTLLLLFMRGHNLASPPSRRMEINNLDPVEGHLGPASVHLPFIEHFHLKIDFLGSRLQTITAATVLGSN